LRASSEDALLEIGQQALTQRLLPFRTRRLAGGSLEAAQTNRPRIFFISSTENARSVSERTLPREAMLSENAG
jgi:hypothetical protein